MPRVKVLYLFRCFELVARKLANFVCEGNSGGYVLGTLAPGLMAGAHQPGSLLCSYGMLAMASCTTPLLRCTMGIVGGAAKCKLCIAAAAAAAARLWCCCLRLCCICCSWFFLRFAAGGSAASPFAAVVCACP